MDHGFNESYPFAEIGHVCQSEERDVYFRIEEKVGATL